MTFKIGDRVTISSVKHSLIGTVIKTIGVDNGCAIHIQFKDHSRWYAKEDVKLYVQLSNETEANWGDILNEI